MCNPADTLEALRRLEAWAASHSASTHVLRRLALARSILSDALFDAGLIAPPAPPGLPIPSEPAP